MKPNLLNADQKINPTNIFQNSNNLDPDSSSYFLVRRATSDSPGASPGFVHMRKESANSLTPKSQKTNKSGTSIRSKINKKKGKSVDSGSSYSSKYRHITEWNEKSASGISPGALTPRSFDTHRHPADPPRPPKAGHEWVWFPEGYWAERELRESPGKRGLNGQSPQSRQKWWNKSPEKSKRASTSATNEQISQTTDLVLPQIKIGNPVTGSARSVSIDGKSTRKNSKVESLLSVKITGFRLSKSEAETINTSQKPEQLGLYARTKNKIKGHLMLPKAPRTSRAEPGADSSIGMLGWGSRTATVLEGAAQYFDRAHQNRGKMNGSTPSLNTPATPDARRSRVLGLAPWHRKTSHDSFLSVSSSVHEILMGRTPAQTPNPEHEYSGHEGRSYPKVEISSLDPNEPSFLPSEARRINTPPMTPGTPVAGAPRGRFFDLNAAKEELDSITGSPATSNGSGGSAPGKPKTNREWWEADYKHIAAGNKSSPQTEKRSVTASPVVPSAFELALPPEHLPSSPLCPKNPKHPCGGSGRCPFHGRRRSVNLKAFKRVNTSNTSTTNETGMS